MRTFRLSLALTLMLASFASLAPSAALAKAGKKKASATSKVAAPIASGSETDKLKGDFKWGMSPDEVLKKMVEKVEATYEERLKKTINDPTKQDRVRKEMHAETEKVKQHSLVKFEGQKTGYDVSIIDQEFSHNTGESMLVAKEETATRYFFFVNDRLYKMFVAFDKDMLQGKSFKDFGQLMQAKYGKAREIYVDEKSKAGVTHKLDHFIWNTKSGDTLRLVDRSGFYDVYCLVIADSSVDHQQAEARKAHQTVQKSDALVDAVTGKSLNNNDENDNVIDRITGRQVTKPGEQGTGPDIKVPMHAPPAEKAATGQEQNKVEIPSEEAKPAAKSKGKAAAKEQPNKPPSGLEL